MIDMLISWFSDNYIEVFGAITGILYVFLEIRQNILLWPVGIITSAVYVWVFLTGKLYADMGLQVYYLVISFLGWYWWMRGIDVKKKNRGEMESSNEKEAVSKNETEELKVSRLDTRTGIILAIVSIFLFILLWLILGRLTDSPVPAWDSLVTSLSIVATWMLARKIYEHWYIWIIVNTAAALLFFSRGLYPTVILYVIYCAMSFAGMIEWKKSLIRPSSG